jgi:hypothetical protein
MPDDDDPEIVSTWVIGSSQAEAYDGRRDNRKREGP